jgi:enoyl-CoA hydratase/carnithine racemase
MTGQLVKEMRACPQPIVAAIDGICAGAGAIVAMASDLRVGTARSKVAFLFVRVGLAGADMGACAILPRIIGQGRASELLYTGRAMDGTEAERWGFYNKLSEPENVLADAQALAKALSDGPSFANSMTKKRCHCQERQNHRQRLSRKIRQAARGNQRTKKLQSFACRSDAVCNA